MIATIRALLLIPLLLIGPLTSKADWGKHSVTEELSGDIAHDASLHIENVNGKIVLRPGMDDHYHILVTKKSKKEENLELIEVRREIDHDRIELKVHFPKKKGLFSFNNIEGSVELEITVPATVNLSNIRTVNGSVELSGFTNNTRASSVNGVIRANDLSGSAELDTVNGTIRASFLSVAPGDELSFSSVNGGINLDFPSDLDADLRTSVVNGRVHCDFPITLDGGSGKRSLRGRIGEGGTSLRASTVNGSIHVREG